MNKVPHDPLRSNYMQLENTDNFMYCHDYGTCVEEYCTLHERSNHSMREFPQHWRGDRGIMERICTHGIGHPDPDDYRFLNGEDDGIHGCCGCCMDGSSEYDMANVNQERLQKAEIQANCSHKWRNEFSNTSFITHFVCNKCDLEMTRKEVELLPNIYVTNIDVTPKVVPLDTLNGYPRVLLDELCELLKAFWHKQPGWGDAAVEGHYAMKIIDAVTDWQASQIKVNPDLL